MKGRRRCAVLSAVKRRWRHTVKPQRFHLCAPLPRKWRERLVKCARTTSRQLNITPYSSLTALRKLFFQEKRRGGIQVGWKRGEIFEVIFADDKHHFEEEVGDLGYYLAQTRLWFVYSIIIPDRIIEKTVGKFENRVAGGIKEIFRKRFNHRKHGKHRKRK